MKLGRITGWLDRTLDVAAFDDASNNGLQIARDGDGVEKVAFAVDGSAKSLRDAAKAGAQLLVVHHGISWGGGIKRVTGGEYEVVRAAIEGNVALYAAHLPLDANRRCGNNWELARYLGLKGVKPAFRYRGREIGVTGLNANGKKIGVCSGGAGAMAAEAKELGCNLLVTGEADWGERVAAENIAMPIVCAGHYETETFGVKALMKLMKKTLGVATTFVALTLSTALFADEERFAGGEEAYEFERFYAGAAAKLVLPQNGGDMRRLGGAGIRAGWYATEMLAFECEGAWMENSAFLGARGLWHWYGYERIDPFFTFGASGWINGDAGPSLGVGTFFHLTGSLSLRFDADATLGIEREPEMAYSLSAGLQYSF